MAKFKMTERISPYSAADVARLGAGTGAGNQINDKEVGKFVKLVGDSQYDLCAAGDPIEGHIESVEAATLDNFSIGSVRRSKPGDRKQVTLDGLQATPGTGTVAVGDWVVCGTVVAKGTALTSGVPAKVCKATMQPGVTEAGAVGDVNDMLKVLAYGWRVVSAAATAVGSLAVIEKV
jgi:hypothetical protein